MVDIFTTRETATIIWFVIFTTIFLFIKQIRASIFDVIKSVFNKYILLYLLSYLVYISLFTYAFFRLKWWDINNLKDTAIWFIFSGLPIGVAVATKKLESGLWKNLVLDNLKLMVLVEFIINLFNFSFFVELLIGLFTMSIILLKNIFRYDREYDDEVFVNFKKLVIVISFILIYSLLSISLYRAITETDSIENINTLKSFLLPVAYSIISVPYMYSLKQYSEYEKLIKPEQYWYR